ncbi:MAG: antibiotic biosynthesis monooxygenase [Chloroflexi bacterium]|nr:antibiotic biosynthesis monooxygenase [Chloroflexota bacterium]
MIARIWRGRTRAQDGDAYAAFLQARAIPDYRRTAGFLRLIFLRRRVRDEEHFTLITLWADWEAVKNFAGEDYERAKYYPEDHDFLLDFPETVEHYEVFAAEPPL